MSKKERYASLALVFAVGCTTLRETGRGPGNNQAEAHSFNVIKAVDDSGAFVVDGYADSKNGASRAISPGAVLIVGVQDGVTLGNERFQYGTIVLVEGEDGRATFRQATQADTVLLSRPAVVFGEVYPKGRFKVPLSGKVNNPLFGEFSGTVDRVAVSFGSRDQTFTLTLLEHPGANLMVSRKVAISAGLYRPGSGTVEDAKGWKVIVRCKVPEPQCAVLSLRKVR